MARARIRTVKPEMLDDEKVAALPHDQREWTREPVDTSGLAAYAILVRAPGDPERRSREERNEAMGREAAGTEWKQLAKVKVDKWAGRFRALLSDGRPRTYNALCVEAADATADVAPDNAEAALWLLKDRGLVEHTSDVPVLWRLTGGW
jgi:hypothetical protein